MEVINASVAEVEGKHFIKIKTGDEDIKIPISEDKSAEVKKAFSWSLKASEGLSFYLELLLHAASEKQKFDIKFGTKNQQLILTDSIIYDTITELKRKTDEELDTMLQGLAPNKE